MGGVVETPKISSYFCIRFKKRAVMRTLFTLLIINGAPQKRYSTKITYL